MPVLTPFSDRDLPLSILNDYSISRKTRAIYIGVIFFAILLLVSLAFINIPSSVKTNGIIRTGPKSYVLAAPVSGTLLKVLKKENQKVGSGDTLLLIEAD